MKTRQLLRYQDAYIRTLERERTQLYKRLGEKGGFAKRIRQAHEDARLLCLWWTGGILPSRRFAMKQNMSQRQWQNAFALCRMARLVVRHHHWIDASPETVEARLGQAVERALACPDEFDKHLNRHGLR